VGKLPRGKLRPDLLKRYIFNRLGIKDPKVLTGPAIGEDAAIIDLGEEVLVAHLDPITEAVSLIGWLAVNVVCNDIAVRGAKPRWLLQALYLPEGSDESLLNSITKQVDEAAKELNVSVVGGHSEVTPGLSRPFMAMVAIGTAPKGRYVTTRGAKPGDLVILTKGVGIEGTAILATDFERELLDKGVPMAVIERGKGYFKKVSVVREALSLAERGLANSMHDPTEGGVLGGVAELAYASGTTIVIYRDKLPISEETSSICRALGLDPLKLMSSGSLLATIPPPKVDEALEELRKLGVRATVIGEVTEAKGSLVEVRGRGCLKVFDVYVEDELVKLWARNRYKGSKG